METLKKILNVIWTLVNNRIFLLALAGIFAFFLIKSCGSSPDSDLKLKITQQNLEAAKDTIRIEKTKNGETNATISGYIASVKELKNINSNLYNQVKDQKGQIITLGNVVFKLKQDSATLQKFLNKSKSFNGSPVYIGNNSYDLPWTLRFDYDDKNYDVLGGNTKIGLNLDDSVNPIKHVETTLLNRETQIDLTFGQKVENNKLRVFAETKYPGFTPTSLSGVLIDPNDNPYLKSLIKKKKWFPNTWAFGISTTFGYNLLQGGGGFVIGPSFTYNFYEW